MMISLLERTFLLSVQAMWHGAILAALVAGVCWLFHRWLAPQWKLCLWSLVLLRLALPFVPPNVLSVFPGFPQAPWTQSITPIVEAPPVITSPRTPTVDVASPSTTKSHGSAIVSQTVHSVPTTAVSMAPESVPEFVSSSSWIGIAIAVWLSGTACLLLRQYVLLLILRRRRSTWDAPQDDRLLRIWEQCQKLVGIGGGVELLTSDDMDGPATAGILRPCVVIPRSLANSLNNDELRHILLHELAHVKRRDLLTLRFASLIACVQWFNPIAWLAWVRTRYELELACDESVLRLLNKNERTSYGHTVLRMVEQFSMPPTVGVTGFGSKEIVTQRIQQIADFRFRPTGVTLLSGLLIAVLAIASLASASPQKEGVENDDSRGNIAATQTPAAEEPGSRENRVMRGRFTDAELPLPNVDIKLYVVDRADRSPHLLQTAKSDDDGGFAFSGLPKLDGETTSFALVATKPGRASIVRSYIMPDQLEEPIGHLEMPEAATVSGRVVDPDGKPVAGADVWLQGLYAEGPMPGVLHAKSKFDGRFEINDTRAWKPAPPRDLPGGVRMVPGPASFFARAKGFGLARPTYKESPTDVGDVALTPEAVITGRVVDDGKPVAGILVSMQSREAGWAEVLTDEDGKYRFAGLGPGKCNVWANPTEDKTCAAVDSLQATPGKTVNAPDIQLVTGGWIEGQVVDQLGDPVATTEQQPAEANVFDEGAEGVASPPTPHSVGLHGPARPKSGAAVQAFPVNPDGTFRFRVPPGKNWPYICTGWNTGLRVLDENGEPFRDGWVDVASGETKQITILYPTKEAAIAIEKLGVPPEAPDDGVILPPPLKKEARIAEWIRHYGGWYDVDGSEHIVSVNMVYHEDDDGKRYDNPQRDTSALLQHLPGLKRLKGLYLHDQQATDETMKYVAQLPNLETFYVWDATEITDEGVVHLSKLKKLGNLHLTNGKAITDKSLAILGQLPEIYKLTLQQNHFTDRGVAHVLKARKLKNLWLGLGETQLSEKAVVRLLDLPKLEVLDVQGSELSRATKNRFQKRKIKLYTSD